MNMMNLVLFSRAIYALHGYGGMERHCHDWILSMAERDCNIHVVTMPPETGGSLSAYPQNVAFYFVPGSAARSVARRITSYAQWVGRAGKLIKQLEHDMEIRAVYAHGLAVAGCCHLQTPVYHNPHGMEEFKSSGLKHIAYKPFRALTRRGARTARKIIATDRSLIQEITHYLHVPESRVELLPNAVRHLPKEVQRQPGGPIFLAAGRLEANKGFPVLLEALSKARLPETWSLYLVGAGSQMQTLQQTAKSLGLDQKIHLIGTASDEELDSLYARAHLFVNPSLYEGSSLVTLQAMSFGLPVIASRTGGLPDKVIPGKNGWLFSPGDSTALAGLLEEACASPQDWPRLGKNAREIIAAEYLWPGIADRFLKLFAETQTGESA